MKWLNTAVVASREARVKDMYRGEILGDTFNNELDEQQRGGGGGDFTSSPGVKLAVSNLQEQDGNFATSLYPGSMRKRQRRTYYQWDYRVAFVVQDSLATLYTSTEFT